MSIPKMLRKVFLSNLQDMVILPKISNKCRPTLFSVRRLSMNPKTRLTRVTFMKVNAMSKADVTVRVSSRLLMAQFTRVNGTKACAKESVCSRLWPQKVWVLLLTRANGSMI